MVCIFKRKEYREKECFGKDINNFVILKFVVIIYWGVWGSLLFCYFLIFFMLLLFICVFWILVVIL